MKKTYSISGVLPKSPLAPSPTYIHYNISCGFIKTETRDVFANNEVQSFRGGPYSLGHVRRL